MHTESQELLDRWLPFGWLLRRLSASGDSPESRLFAAARDGDAQAVAHLLESYGLHVDVRDRRGWTALMVAAYHGHAHIMQLLLERGANAAGSNRRGQTAMTCAVERGWTDAICVLRQANSGSQRQAIRGALQHMSPK